MDRVISLLVVYVADVMRGCKRRKVYSSLRVGTADSVL